MTPEQLAAWRAAVVEVAIEELGKGETTANNVGPDLERYGANPTEPWCAALASYCCEEAARRVGVTLPFTRSLSALRLARHVTNDGTNLELEQAGPGDLIAWYRGPDGSGQGHIGIIEQVDGDGVVHTIEGNVGAFPSKVKRLVHDPKHERLAVIAGLR